MFVACGIWCLADVSSVKAHANGRNKYQQLPTLMDVVGQQCCIRLHGPKSLTGFKLYATSANKCQQVPTLLWFHANGRHNIVGPNNVGCCWPTMLRPFAWAFSSLLRRRANARNVSRTISHRRQTCHINLCAPGKLAR